MKLPVMLVTTVAQGNGESMNVPTNSASQKRITLPMAPPSAIHRLLSSMAAAQREEPGARRCGERGPAEEGRGGADRVPQEPGDHARDQHRDAAREVEQPERGAAE